MHSQIKIAHYEEKRPLSPLSCIQRCIDNMTPIQFDSADLVIPSCHTHQSSNATDTSNNTDTADTAATTSSITNSSSRFSFFSSSSSQKPQEQQQHQQQQNNDNTNLNIRDVPTKSFFCADPIHLHSFSRLSSLSTILVSRIKICCICQIRPSMTEEILSCLACGIHAHRSCLVQLRPKLLMMMMNKEKNSKISWKNEEEDEDGELSSSSLSSTSPLIQICPVNKKIFMERTEFYTKFHSRKEAVIEDTTCCSKTSMENKLKTSIEVNSETEEKSIGVPPVETSTSTATIATKVERISINNSFDHHSETQKCTVITDVYDNDDDDKSLLSSSSSSSSSTNNTNSLNSNDKNNKEEIIWSDSGPITQHWAMTSPDLLRGISQQRNKIVNDDQKKNLEEDSTIGQQQEQEYNLKQTLTNLSKALQVNLLLNIMKNRDRNYDDDDENDDNKDNNDIHCEIEDIEKSTSNGTCSQDNEEKDDNNQIKENAQVTITNIANQLSFERAQQDHQNDEKNDNDDDTLKKNSDNDDTQLQNLDLKVLDEVKSKEIKSPTSPSRSTLATGTTRMLGTFTLAATGALTIAGTVAGGVVGFVIAGPAGAYVGSKIGQLAGVGGGVAGVILEGTVGVGFMFASVKGTMYTVNQLQGENKRLLTIGEKGTECKVVLVRPNVIVDPIWEEITLKAKKAAPIDTNKINLVGLNFLKHDDRKRRRKRDEDIVHSQDSEITMKEKIFLLVSSSLNDKKSLPGFIYRQLVAELRKRAAERQLKAKAERPPCDRSIRQDVHGIIKHITATLLQVRPGFSSSPRITELSASAVESLVFGQLYDLVFEEILNETKEKDQMLTERISRAQIDYSSADFIADGAIYALQELSNHHSVSDKLSCCVDLLQCISNQGEMSNMSADSLLKMVCQHIVIANVNNLNAECLFLEEFARDEQLLRGKEGYALVTLQASLNFLNACSDFMSDVFSDDD